MAVRFLVKNFYKYKMPICLIIALNFISYKSLSNTNQDFDNHSPQHIKIAQDNSTNFDEAFIYQDWVNDSKPYRACPGYFRSPTIPQVLKPEISADTFEFAKQGTSILNGNVVYLDQKNKVSANQALVYRNDKLNKITKIKAQGNIEYLTDDIRVISNLININLLNNTAVIDSPSYFSFYPRNARGHAQKSVLIKDQSYTIYDSSFTTCPPGDYAWHINSEKIVFDPVKEIGTAKNTYLYFYKIPVFYTPYLRFSTSTKRESGLLMPIYSSSSRYGYSIATPLYLNLAPNYDVTLTPRYMTKRDWQFAIEARHLNKNGSNTSNFEYLPDDKEFESFRKLMQVSNPLGLAANDPRITNLSHASKQRYALNIIDNRQWLNGLSSNIDYSYLSDNQYFLDLPKTSIIRENTGGHLLQQAKINYSYHNWRLALLTQGYQTLHTLDGPDLTEPYRILPAISLSNNNILLTNQNFYNINIPLLASIDAHATRFASPSNPKATKLAEGQRYYIKPSISVPIQKSYGYITPKIATSIRYYDLNRLSPSSQMLNYNKNQDYIIPIYSIDSGLFFDKNLAVNNKSFIHSFEPRLFYLNIPKKDQNQAPDFDIKQSTISYEQLFRDNSFNGYDRQDSANLVTTGIVSRIKNSTNGTEYAKLQIGQSYYFEDKSTTICNQDLSANCISIEKPAYQKRLSPFISILDFDISSIFNSNDKLYGLAEWQWDYFLNTTNKISLGFHYANNYIYNKTQQTLINFEYNFLKEGNIQTNVAGNRIFKVNDKHNDLSTLETSLKFPLHKNLILLGFYSYDIRNQASLDKYFGAELQNCCWALRAGYRSQLRLRTNSLAPKKYDNIFTVQFSLKGLGEINQSFENILRSNITGYQNQLDQIY